MKSKPSNSSSESKLTLISGLFGKRPPKYLDKLESAGYRTIEDLLWIFPLRFEVIPQINNFKLASPGSAFMGWGKVYHREKKFSKGANRFKKASLSNLVLRVFDQLAESNDMIDLTFFNLYPSQVKTLMEAETIVFSGEVSIFNGKKQVVNPEVLALNPDSSLIDEFKKREQSVRPVYPTVNKVKPDEVRRTFELIPDQYWQILDDIVPQDILAKYHYPTLSEALKSMHGKVVTDDKAKARESLIFREFFSEQCKLLVRRSIIRSKKIKPIKVSDEIFNKSQKLFPFELTVDQQTTLKAIISDLNQNYSMMRLVQGDVGSGKTAVAIASAFCLARLGFQTAFMCPTESLANQHFQSFEQFLSSQGIQCALLTGSVKGKKRNELLAKLKSGEISVLIGTHALIVDDVHFKNLGMVIIDEQHKFGVDQRLKLTAKSATEHCLIMTATPIPRSLSLSQYGDLDVSIIKSMPSNRKGIKSRIVTDETYPQFLSFLKTRHSMGEQAFVVVPAIEESETLDMTNLQDTVKVFRNYFPDIVIESLHGRMKPQEKDDIVSRFSKNEIGLIVATSVVEVGINIPNASVMAVLNPERFGLSSLHQLRGRVGRGDKPGFFFLVLDKKVSSEALNRLQTIESTTDGFIIAEEDLKMRGEGDILGKAQSGIDNQKRIANLTTDGLILENARHEVLRLFEHNREFAEQITKRFEYDPMVRLTI